MIYSCLEGRLGNILFEIAAGASLAKKMNVPFRAVTSLNMLSFPDNCSLADYVKQFQQSILRKIEFLDTYPEILRNYQESGFEYNPLPMEKNLVLKGFFQSEKYFDEQLVRELFHIDQQTENYIREKYKDILRRKPVSVLVRRGDFLKVQYKHPVCRMSYYNKAMSLFPPDTDFLIISDDIAWCKKHFQGTRFFFIEDEPPLVDLYIQSLCEHNIISNSSFGWWGAWLNPNKGKKVIYPTPWCGIVNRKTRSVKDQCPENWIKVPMCAPVELFFRDYYSLAIKSFSSFLHILIRLLQKHINEDKYCKLKNYLKTRK